jgi:hypothetical protein
LNLITHFGGELHLTLNVNKAKKYTMRKLLFMLLIAVTLSGCTQWKNYRAKRLIERAKDKLEKAEELKPGSVSGDTTKTEGIVFVPVLIPGDTITNIFTSTSMNDTIHRVESERGTVLIEIDYPDYAKDFMSATEALPEPAKESVRKIFRKVIASDIKYTITSEIPSIDTLITVQATNTQIGTIVFEEKVVAKTPARNKWLIGLLIAIIGAIFAMVFLFLRKKRKSE